MTRYLPAGWSIAIGAVILSLPTQAGAASAIDSWRANAAQVRNLAENDVALAYKEAVGLQESIPSNAQPEDRARVLNILSRVETYLGETELADRYAKQAFELAKSNNDRIGQAEADLNVAMNAVNQGRFDAMSSAVIDSMTMLSGVDRPDLLSEAMLRTSMMYRRFDQFEDSVTLAMQGMEIAKRNNNPLALTYAYQGMAIAHDLSGRKNEARGFYEKMLGAARDAHSSLLEADALLGLGLCIATEEIGRGEQMIRKAIEMYRKAGGPFYVAHGQYMLADILRKQGRIAEAQEALNEAEEIYEQHSNSVGLWWVLNLRSTLFQMQSMLSEANAAAEHAYMLAREIGHSIYLSESTRQLAAIRAARGNFKQAYALSLESAEISNENAKEKASMLMVDLAKRYESESRQRQLDELVRQNENQQIQHRWLWTIFGATLFLLVLSGYFLLHLRRSHHRLKAANALLERSQNKQRAILDAIPDTLFEFDLEGRYIEIHASRQDDLISSSDAIIGRTVSDAMPPDVATIYLRALRIANENGTCGGMEIAMPLSHGERWFELSVARKTVNDGRAPHFIVLSRDITERKRMERQLHVREQEFRAMVEHSPDIIARYDTQCRRIYVNPAMQRQFGISIEAILGKTPLDSSAMREAPAYMRMIQSVLQSAQESQMEFSFFDPQGGERWGHMRLVPEFGPDVAVVSVLAITRDITERKRAEDTLIAREREFRTLAENIPDNIIRYDNQARKIYLNSAAVRLMGKESGELLGRTPEETLPATGAMQVGEFTRKVLQVLDTGEAQELEISLRHAQEGMQIHNVKFAAERDAQGNVAGVLAIGRDVTAHKAAEEALREREQRYHEIFDNAVEGMYLLEVTEDGRFLNLDINPALAQSVGIPREAMIGRFVDDTVPEDTGRLIVEKYRRCIAEGTTITENIELDLPAGKRYYYSTITPIRHDGRIQRLIGISRDITRLKQTERELEESRAQLRGLTARREEAREEERKYIAREVHDELGQLLTGLKLNISLLNHKCSAESEKLREYLNETMLLADRSLEVARNVASALRPAVLEMGIVSALEWLAGRFGANTGIACKIDVVDADIQIDEKRAIALFRIVQESLTNVSRHAQADEIEIALTRETDDYLLKVRDNGKGFDASRNKMNSYGLVGIRERALMLGGAAVIDSHPGKGTTVVVRIPVHNILEES